MSDLENRAPRKRIRLPGHFTFPVLVEHVSVHDGTALVRVRRPDGGMEDVTVDVAEIEEALSRASATGVEIVSGREVFEALEAVRIRLAYHYDPYFAVSLSGVRALPHQLEAVYERLLPSPSLRFVLAHDPGAGKTIMAGLLIKELKLRGVIERVLILVPSPLTPQWQDELAEKFDEIFEIVDSHIETGQVAGNIWQRKTQCIASIDYAKRDSGDTASGRSVRDAILQCSWDLVIVDEAHKASAALYGEELKATKRYKLVEELSRSPHVQNLLLLTATPHQGKEDQFRLFPRLLDPDQFEAQDMVVTYLAMALDKLADNNCSLATWESTDQIVKHALSQQALKMIWDFAEMTPLARLSGSFPLMVEAEAQAIRGLATVPLGGRCTRSSATDLPFPDASFDALITDPPYYVNISYADLSDFFFVWLKRTLGPLYPEHLSAGRAPKKQEATVTPYRHGGDDAKAQVHYEKLMTKALREGGRVVKPGGPVVVVYAHKTVAGWATLVDALRGAGCTVREAWPLRTESDARLNARGTAALATSIFLVARKREESDLCSDYEEDVLPEVARVIGERVRSLWEAGLTGADLVVAVIGAALGPFTRNTSVRRANGAEVTTGEFLEEAQRAALDAIIRQVVRDVEGKDASVGAIDPISRLYVVARLQFGEAPADYDMFKNLAIGALPPGTELDGMKGALMQGRKALLAKKGGKVTIRGFDARGAEIDLGLPEDGRTPTLIDVLHRLLWLQKNRPSEVPKFLQAAGADLGAVRLLAQALGGRPLRAEPTPGSQKDERTGEQRSIDTLLASFQDITRSAMPGPLFGGPGKSREV